MNDTNTYFFTPIYVVVFIIEIMKTSLIQIVESINLD